MMDNRDEWQERERERERVCVCGGTLCYQHDLMKIYIYIYKSKFYNILVSASLQRVYHVTEAVQAVVGTLCGW